MGKRLEANVRAVTIEQSRARGDIEFLRENMVTRREFRGTMELVMNRLDGLAGKMDDMIFSMAKQNDRLDGHENRLTRLEKRPS